MILMMIVQIQRLSLSGPVVHPARKYNKKLKRKKNKSNKLRVKASQ